MTPRDLVRARDFHYAIRMSYLEAYSERYVAFLDVLGFSQLVRDADVDEKKRGVIRRIIRALRDTLSEVPPSTGFRYTQFSDCIVISADRSEDGLVAVATGCVGLVGTLMTAGILLRGGIAVGNLLHSKDELFGTGLLRAYSSDATGSPPRIALCDETYRDAKKHDLEDLTRQDILDLSPMLHTLWEYQSYSEAEWPQDQVLEDARLVVGHISRNAGDMSLHPSVRAKWRWLRLYWNDTVEGTGDLPAVL